VWNLLSGADPQAVIKDYDLAYCDPFDLRWSAEDRVIRAVALAFNGLAPEAAVRNQAWVHLWYRSRFGRDCPRYGSAEAAIETFPATSSCAWACGCRPTPAGASTLPMGSATCSSRS